MIDPGQLVQAGLALLLPAGAVAAARRWRPFRLVGPVVVCYALGLLLANQEVLAVDTALAMRIGQISVVLAIPLLLFSVDLRAWLSMASASALSFGLCLVSVMVSSAGAALLFAGRVPESPRIAGMLVGVYTGGTPNMAAIGNALGVDSETFVILNAADIAVTSVYLLFLLTVAGPLLARFYRASPRGTPLDTLPQDAEDGPALPTAAAARPLVVAGAVLALSVGLGALAPKDARDPVTLLALTTLGIGASLVGPIRRLPGAHDLGQYLLLVFCVAIGSTAELDRLLAASPVLVVYVLVVVVASVLLHLLLAALFRIDRDTVLITSTAAIFGPAFVGPVALALGNREVILSGLAAGLLGYALGNYLGLALFWMLS